MYRNRSKSLAVFVLYVASVVALNQTAVAHASTRTASMKSPGCADPALIATRWTDGAESDAAPAGLRHDDLAGLARAYRDVLEAEQALRKNPAAAARFGQLLSEARARLDAGLAASTRAQDEIRDATPAETEALHSVSGECGAQVPAQLPVASSGQAAPPHHRVRGTRLIWV